MSRQNLLPIKKKKKAIEESNWGARGDGASKLEDRKK